jgi:hypothetical protein
MLDNDFVLIHGRSMENDRLYSAKPAPSPLKATEAIPQPVASKEELQAFVQVRTYYYLPKWEALDPRIAPGPFNWAACFLGFYWMAYRRMYLYLLFCYACWIVLFFILGITSTAPRSVGASILTLCVCIFVKYKLGRYGSSLYKIHVERKIKQIKTTTPPEYWTEAFRDKGGTSLLAPATLIILILLMLYLMLYLGIVKQ